MRNFLLSLVLVALAGATAWTFAYRRCCDPELRQAAKSGDAEHWLRLEFHLSDAQMAAIETLQVDYSKECSVHCRNIMDAKARLASLKADPATTPQTLTAAKLELDAREASCRDAIKAHLRKVAALMPAQQGERYLAMLMPKVDTFRHEGAPNLRLDP